MELISFWVGERNFAVRMDQVKEVAQVEEVLPVPDAVHFVQGIVPFRDGVIPAVNLSRRLNLPEQVSKSSTQMVVAHCYEHEIGLLIDRTDGLIEIDDSQVTAPDEFLAEAQYLEGVVKRGKELIFVMDVERLLSDSEHAHLRELRDRHAPGISLKKKVAAAESPDSAQSLQRLLLFSMGKERYCVGLDQIKEVVHSAHLTWVPNLPALISGVMNYRGEILSIVDLARLLDLEGSGGEKKLTVLVSDAAGPLIGIAIGRLEGVVEVDLRGIEPPLSTLGSRLASYTKGEVRLDRGILTQLDIKKILTGEEVQSLAQN